MVVTISNNVVTWLEILGDLEGLAASKPPIVGQKKLMYGTHFGVVHVCNDLFTRVFHIIYIVEVECDTGGYTYFLLLLLPE